jgi:hypothetical protein
MALDEHRAAYKVPLWTHTSGKEKPGQVVEQRWFIGAHANVGGGYGKDPLADIPFEWLLKKAAENGLKMDSFTSSKNAWQTAPRPSFDEFLKGIYSVYRRIIKKGDGKFYRDFSIGDKGKPAINITVDPSVWLRWEDMSCNYRPRTLINAGQTPPK